MARKKVAKKRTLARKRAVRIAPAAPVADATELYGFAYAQRAMVRASLGSLGRRIASDGTIHLLGTSKEWIVGRSAKRVVKKPARKTRTRRR